MFRHKRRSAPGKTASNQSKSGTPDRRSASGPAPGQPTAPPCGTAPGPPPAAGRCSDRSSASSPRCSGSPPRLCSAVRPPPVPLWGDSPPTRGAGGPAAAHRQRRAAQVVPQQVVYHTSLPHGNSRAPGVVVAGRHPGGDVLLVVRPDAAEKVQRTWKVRYTPHKTLKPIENSLKWNPSPLTSDASFLLDLHSCNHKVD